VAAPGTWNFCLHTSRGGSWYPKLLFHFWQWLLLVLKLLFHYWHWGLLVPDSCFIIGSCCSSYMKLVSLIAVAAPGTWNFCFINRQFSLEAIVLSLFDLQGGSKLQIMLISYHLPYFLSFTVFLIIYRISYHLPYFPATEWTPPIYAILQCHSQSVI
jgi:hypothetical protein